MSTYEFPSDLLKARGFQPRLVNNAVAAPNTLLGLGQSADWSGGGYWAFDLKEIRVTTVEQHLAWRELCLKLSGGFTEAVVPFIDSFTWPVGAATPETMDFSASEAADIGETTLYIAVDAGGPLKAGNVFTIVHPLAGERLYGIRDAGTLMTGVQVCKIDPPLREAVAADTALDFKDPRLLMTVASDPKTLWTDISPPYTARPSVTFRESFNYQNVL